VRDEGRGSSLSRCDGKDTVVDGRRIQSGVRKVKGVEWCRMNTTK
jgi:hypothetical protein